MSKKLEVKNKIEDSIIKQEEQIKQRKIVQKANEESEIQLKKEKEYIGFDQAFRIYKTIEPKAQYYNKQSVLVFCRKKLPNLMATKEEYINLLKKY